MTSQIQQTQAPYASQKKILSVALEPGVKLGPYVIRRSLGQGGFGITYLAHDREHNRDVVLKENLPIAYACRNIANKHVQPLCAAEGTSLYENYLEKFLTEARTLSKLHHRNIVQVLKAFKALGTAYYVMPWVGGKELIKEAPKPTEITEAWLTDILARLLEALEYLHSNGLLHRDIKPNNILLNEAGEPILIDFGCARTIDHVRSSCVVQSLGYTPFEQICAELPVGPWSDIYSLGATCYRLITGKNPPPSTDRTVVKDTYVPLMSDDGIRARFSARFLEAIDKAMERDYAKRWQSAAEWRYAIIGGKKPEVKRNYRKLWLTVCLLLAVGGGELIYRGIRNSGLKEAAAHLVQTLESRRQYRALPHAWQMKEAMALLQEKPELRETLLKQAEEDARTAHAAAAVLSLGLGGTKEPTKALQLLRQSAAGGHAPAMHELAMRYLFGLGCARDLQAGHELLSKATAQQYAPAFTTLGYCYENGLGVPADTAKAREHYETAAAQLYPPALCRLAQSLEASQQATRAPELYRLAAEAQFPIGMERLGDCYATGIGVLTNSELATFWHKKAISDYRTSAELGDPISQFRLAMCYQNGTGTDVSLPEAFKWYATAAEQQYAPALYALGECYELKIGTERDLQKAFEYYKAAADMDYPQAHFRLALCYENGIGTEINRDKAIEHYEKASQMNHEEARNNLLKLTK